VSQSVLIVSVGLSIDIISLYRKISALLASSGCWQKAQSRSVSGAFCCVELSWLTFFANVNIFEPLGLFPGQKFNELYRMFIAFDDF
jgi:hypothetical protein